MTVRYKLLSNVARLLKTKMLVHLDFDYPFKQNYNQLEADFIRALGLRLRPTNDSLITLLINFRPLVII